MTAPSPTRLRSGHVASELADEFPGLRVRLATVTQGPRSSPPALVRRLAALSDRYRGAGVVSLRTRPVPSAFRTFFRQIGLDPDVERIPAEAVAVARLLHGGFRSTGLIADACLVAVVETGVAVWALDADGVDERDLGIRVCTGADVAALGPAQAPPPGSLVVADGRRVHALLFGDPLPGRAVSAATRRVTLYSVGVDGVPVIHVEEAMWTVLELLGAAGGG